MLAFITNPIVLSLLSNVGVAVLASAATWAAAQQNPTLAAIGGALAALLAAWRGTQHTQSALISQVNNSDNGVKVVSATSAAPQVDGPMK